MDIQDSTSDPDDAQGMPRWVKAFIAIGVVLLVLLVVTQLAGADHGTGRHGDDKAQTLTEHSPRPEPGP